MNPDSFDKLGKETPDLRALFPRRAKLPRHQPREWFLKGPVPWGWIRQASALRGKALAVGLALWREAGRRGTQPVKVCQARIARDLGTSPDTVRRALRELERAGLVTILRRPGRGLDVTIRDAAPSAAGP